MICLSFCIDFSVYFNRDANNLDSSVASGLSLTSLSSIQKFSMKDSSKGSKGQCYMGVCLPLHLTDLFPGNERNRRATKTISVAHSLEGKCTLYFFTVIKINMF